MTNRTSRLLNAMKSIGRDMALMLAFATAAALGVNALRSEGLPLFAEKDYEILVPCPETAADVDGVPADDPRLRDADTLLVDARAPAEHAAWSLPRAVSLPYDYLEPTPEEAVASLLHARAAGIVVFGDGGDPDSGEQLARELAGRGVRRVVFVQGGADALRAARGEERP